jgi:periplasmic divalent cation tolerance protein
LAEKEKNREDTMVLLYVTCADHAEAEKIGRALIEERLAACVNIFDNMHSIYRWQEAIEESRESVLLCKTRASLEEICTRRICELHSYTTPCVLAFPAKGGNPGYLDWIQQETAG